MRSVPIRNGILMVGPVQSCLRYEQRSFLKSERHALEEAFAIVLVIVQSIAIVSLAYSGRYPMMLLPIACLVSVTYRWWSPKGKPPK